jgi:pimeloyl-ACP methyl ester carboxylesterase
MQEDIAASRAKIEKDREAALATPAEDLSKSLESLLTPTDAAALTGELAEYLSWSMKDGLAPGVEGWWEDSVAFSGPWGFDLAQISVPVLVVHGRQDMFVPFGHGEWLAAHVPGAEAWLLDNDGHVTLMENRMGEVHAWLADRANGAAGG